MDVSAVTLDVLDAAVVNTLADASPAEQGQLLADLIRKFDAESVLAPDPVPAPDQKRECKFKKCHRPWVIEDGGRYCAEHHTGVLATRATNAAWKPRQPKRNKPKRPKNKHAKPPKAPRPSYYGANMYAPIRFGGLRG